MTATAVRHRVPAGFAVLLTLFLTVVVLQMVVDERLDAANARRVAAIQRVSSLNHAVLQHLTDAETGVRGLQLTGEPAFLEPYTSGRAAAAAALDELEARTAGDGRAGGDEPRAGGDEEGTGGDEPRAGGDELRALVAAERQAAAQWIYGYAVPVVNAGVADADLGRAGRGKALFDALRTANADVDAATDTRLRAAVARAHTESVLADLVFGALAVLLLLAGPGLARMHRREPPHPLDAIRSAGRPAGHPGRPRRKPGAGRQRER